MPIKRIQITNLARFTTFDQELPMVCLIQGGNGTGKTSLLDCVRFLGESGHDPDILHGNAAEGEVIVTLDDGMQLRARVTRQETWRGWKPKDGTRWLKGREEIEKIYRAIAYDPIAFLSLTPKAQAETLAALSPVQATPEELLEAVGEADPEGAAAKLRPGMSGIETINAIHKAVYDARTVLNVGADTQEKHAAELEKALPPATEDGSAWADRVDNLTALKVRLEGVERDAMAALGREFQDAKEHQRDLLDAANKAIDAKIRDLETERVAATEKANQAIEFARGIANTEAARLKADNKPKLDKLTADLATAQERARSVQQAEGTRRAATVARDEAVVKRTRSKALTGALARLAALKSKLAAQLPIKGAMVEGDQIVREQDGGLVPLKKWNTADQYILCLKIGMMIGGNLVVLDHGESWDEAHFTGVVAAAKKYAAEKGVQFLIAAVDSEGGPLKVTEAGSPGWKFSETREGKVG